MSERERERGRESGSREYLDGFEEAAELEDAQRLDDADRLGVLIALYCIV